MPNIRTPARLTPGLLPASASNWVIVLSGGQGERLAPFVQEWLGETRPKQYCRFVGAKSMLEHTLVRARALVPDAHVLTVAAPEHQPFLSALGFTGELLYQPRACGTAPGIFLPLTAIAATEPTALVHIMPSDHFIYPRERFLRHLTLTEKVVRAAPNRVVLTAAVPDMPETDFGWIQPGRAVSGGGWAALRIKAFHEKPAPGLAARYLRAGYLWNTMIVTCTAETLWQLAAARLPRMLERFESLRAVWRTATREQATLAAYATMPAYDFSRDLLEQSSAECLVLPMHGIAWSDWGRPARIAASVAEFGLMPNYAQPPAALRAKRFAS
jgi:mannose-1-phosphate guanylyltransferase